MEQAIRDFAATGDKKALLKAAKKHYGIKSVHKKAQPYLFNELDLAGTLSLAPFEKTWKNCRTYKDLFSRFGDTLFPALCIGSDSYGVEFWLVLTTGTVISLHHDASFSEVAFDVNAANEVDFVKKFAKAGSAFTIEQLAQFQQETRDLTGDDSNIEREYFLAAAKVLSLTVSRMAKRIYELPLEFVFVRCRDFIDEKLDDFLAAEKKIKALSKLKGKSKKKIELSFAFLKKLPDELLAVKACEELDLSGNLFTDLSNLSDVCQQIGVLKLDLSQCSLKKIPDLPSTLKELDLSENELEEDTVDELRRKYPHCAINNKVDTFSPANTALDLSFRNLKKMPRGFEKMTALEELDLQGNPKLDFAALFETLSKYKNLKKLNLRFCKLEQMPDEICKVTSLEEVICDGERHYAHKGKENTIELGQLLSKLAKLPNLCTFSTNNFRKPLDVMIDWLPNLKALETLTVHVDKYGDSAEKLAELIKSMSALPKLVELTFGGDMEADWLSGLGTLKAVRKLRVSGSYMNDVPLGVFELTELEELYLGANYKTIPGEIKNLKKLRKLKIQGNQKPVLKLPDEFGELTALEDFELVSTWTHSLPDTIGQLSSLKRLKVNSEGLTELPRSIGELKQLEILDLYGSKVKTLPETIGKLSSLRELDLADNYYLGALPDTIGQLQKLERLNLRSTSIKVLPDSFFNLKLRDLEVYSAHEDRYLSIDELFLRVHEFSNLERLSAKRFDKKPFKLPDTFSQLKSLKSLELCVGVMDDEHTFKMIGTLHNLEELDLSFYGFETVSEAFEELKSLRVISVDLGRLSDKASSEFFTRLAALPALRKIDCKWKGAKRIPDEVGLLRNVFELDFFQNQLKDVPETLLKLTQLKSLDLRANSIPSARIKAVKKALPSCEVLA